MKVIKSPSTINVTEETCKVCGAILELNPWDYKKKKHITEDIFTSDFHCEKRTWFICPCCNSVNVTQVLFDGEELKSYYDG